MLRWKSTLWMARFFVPVVALFTLLAMEAAAEDFDFTCGMSEGSPKPVLGPSAKVARIYGGPYVPTTDTTRALVIFVKFEDDTFDNYHTTDPDTEWPSSRTTIPAWGNNIIDNSTSHPHTTGSLTDFFCKMSKDRNDSDGKFHLIGDVYPDLVVPDHPRPYYYRDTVADTGGIGMVEKEILEEIDPDVNFADYDNYDNDDPSNRTPDGIVDLVFFIFRFIGNGDGEKEELCGLSYSGIAKLGYGGYAADPYIDNLTLDGKDFRSAFPSVAGGMSPSGTQQEAYTLDKAVETLAHEYGHLLFGGGHHGYVGCFGLMDLSTGKCGTGPMCAYEREKLSWIDPQVISSSTTNISITEAITTSDIYKIKYNDNEYFLMENRQRTSYWDQNLDPGEDCGSYLPGTGLLITHVKRTIYGDILVEPADNTLIQYGDPGDSGDTFRSGHNNWFTRATTPDSKGRNGEETGIAIINISASGATMTFDAHLNYWSGPITTNTTWSNDAHGNPIYVGGDITVLSSATLTIQSSATVNLNGHCLKSTGGAITDNGATWDPDIAVKQGSTLKGHYSTIQSAITGASSGQTVYVAPDTYDEHDISMKTGVDLKKSSGTVTIEADYPYKVAIFSGVSNITVDGITFSGERSSPAVQVLNCGSGIEFTDCEFLQRQSGSGNGLHLSGGSSSVTGQECYFHGCSYGLFVINASPTFDNKNRFYDNYIGVMCLYQGLPDLSPNNNFSYPSVNSSYDIAAWSNVTGNIDASYCYWGDGGRDPVVLHNGSGTIITSNPLGTPAKIVVDTRPIVRAQEKLRTGDRAGALAEFKAIIAAPASQEEALAAVHGVMFACNQTPGEVDAALSYLEGIQNSHRGSELEAAALYVSISGLVSRGRPEEALSSIERILRDHPTSSNVPYALLEKAFLLDYTYKDKQGAEETFAQIAATYPDWILTPMVKQELEALNAWRHMRDGVQEEEEPVVLLRVYPNPSNPSTTLCFVSPHAGLVKLSIYNLLGQSVRTLVDEQRAAGRYSVTWDGRDAQGVAVGSGLYVARMEAGGAVHTRKLLLLR